MPFVVNEFELVAEPAAGPPAPADTPRDRGEPGQLALQLRRLLAQGSERAARVRAY